MKKDLNCPYTIIDKDIICEHKLARIDISSIRTLHNHDGYEIVLFLRGDASIIVESVEKKLERGDMVFISPFSFHGLNLNFTDIDKYERIVLNIRYNYLQELCDDETDLTVCFHQISPGRPNIIHLSEDALQQFVSIGDRLEKSINTKQYCQKLLSRALLSEFMVLACQYMKLSVAANYESIMPAIISNVVEYIEQNISGNISVSSIANHLHYNPDYLSRAFKNTTGLSLKHYINAKKCSLAQQYLHQGYSPYDVCFMIGFNNYSSFSRLFSEIIGCSPKQYQMKYQCEYCNKLLSL